MLLNRYCAPFLQEFPLFAFANRLSIIYLKLTAIAVKSSNKGAWRSPARSSALGVGLKWSKGSSPRDAVGWKDCQLHLEDKSFIIASSLYRGDQHSGGQCPPP